MNITKVTIRYSLSRLGFLQDVKWAIYPEKYRDLRKWSELNGDAKMPYQSGQRANCDRKAT